MSQLAFSPARFGPGEDYLIKDTPIADLDIEQYAKPIIHIKGYLHGVGEESEQTMDLALEFIEKVVRNGGTIVWDVHEDEQIEDSYIKIIPRLMKASELQFLPFAASSSVSTFRETWAQYSDWIPTVVSVVGVSMRFGETNSVALGARALDKTGSKIIVCLGGSEDVHKQYVDGHAGAMWYVFDVKSVHFSTKKMSSSKLLDEHTNVKHMRTKNDVTEETIRLFLADTKDQKHSYTVHVCRGTSCVLMTVTAHKTDEGLVVSVSSTTRSFEHTYADENFALFGVMQGIRSIMASVTPPPETVDVVTAEAPEAQLPRISDAEALLADSPEIIADKAIEAIADEELKATESEPVETPEAVAVEEVKTIEAISTEAVGELEALDAKDDKIKILTEEVKVLKASNAEAYKAVEDMDAKLVAIRETNDNMKKQLEEHHGRQAAHIKDCEEHCSRLSSHSVELNKELLHHIDGVNKTVARLKEDNIVLRTVLDAFGVTAIVYRTS